MADNFAVEVRLWGRTIGAAAKAEGDPFVSFQYSPPFANSGMEVSPITMPLSTRAYRFAELSLDSFRGLPGLLADSLPDKYGNALIDSWLALQGRSPDSFSALERLCYTGSRGMGALEYRPLVGPRAARSPTLEIDKLVALASDILTKRGELGANFAKGRRAKALGDILRVGTSAGGARAKAVIAWNSKTNQVRSGQVPTDSSFSYWLLKFDGVANNRDKELNDPKGFGAVEYAYSLMAKAAGINMSECRILEENGRRHFMTRRFDRLDGGEKLHMQSLGALAHYDFNMAGAYSYEQALGVIRRLGLKMEDVEQQFRRMTFNIVARNQDDHVKNIAFLMDKGGNWSLAPAFDVTYSFNPAGGWTATHQMTMNGKRDAFTKNDFRECARNCGLKQGRADAILGEIVEVVSRWKGFADEAGVEKRMIKQIEATHRLSFEQGS